MDIVIDLSGASGTGVANPFAAMWFLLTHGAWVVLIPVFIYGAWQGWLEYIRNKFSGAQKYVLLAVDVPKENEQSPKAVEQIFAHLLGVQKRGNIKERLIDGYTQLGFSLELISIEGYVQFLIRTPEKFRDLVEAAFYAQYPNAEIAQVNDYTAAFQPKFPNEEFDLWGTELKQTNKQFYPIKTYPSFEHSLSQTFFDPMANILEAFSRLGRGEQYWLQIVIEPASDRWRDEGVRLVKKLIGSKTSEKKTNLGWLPAWVSQGLYESAVASVLPTSPLASETGQDKAPPSLMLHLPPHDRAVVEQVGIKLSKPAFLSKIRLMYVAKHDVFSRKRRSAMLGPMRQFNTLDLNGFILDKKTKTNAELWFPNLRGNWRKLRRLYGYKYRSLKRGRNKFILNVEELATLYHFPVTTVVKAPRVQKTESKRGEPPASLPVEAEFLRSRPFAPGQETVASTPELEPPVTPPAIAPQPTIQPVLPGKHGAAPDNLPV
ncbi:MAG: hypothetical protein HY421_02895 [Candidatus Kerfeldbacteria bacterium]|nr:hypothetical protein [Candidatus Kerfeldbacteria bacterium]